MGSFPVNSRQLLLWTLLLYNLAKELEALSPYELFTTTTFMGNPSRTWELYTAALRCICKVTTLVDLFQSSLEACPSLRISSLETGGCAANKYKYSRLIGWFFLVFTAYRFSSISEEEIFGKASYQ